MTAAVLAAVLVACGRASAQYHIDTWSTEQGLPQNSINAIQQSPDGFLWLATFGGLARFDGVSFRVYDTTTNPELPNSRLLGLRADADGNLWMVTENRLLLRFRAGKFVVATPADGLPTKGVTGTSVVNGVLIAETSKGTVQWAGGRFVPYAWPAGKPRSDRGDTMLGNASSGAIWYRRADGAVRRWSPDGTVQSVSLAIQPPIYEDSHGRLWRREGWGLQCQDGPTLRTYTESDLHVRVNALRVTEDPDGTLWFTTDNGLLMFHDGRFAHVTVAEGLPDNNIRAIYRDREGTHWLGTTNGLARMSEQAVKTFSTADGLEADNTYPITQDAAGDVWLGNWTGLTRFHDGVFTPYSDALGIGKALVLSLLSDRDGALWIGGYGGGVSRVLHGHMTRFSPADGAPTTTFVIYQRPNGDIWFGCAAGAVRYRDGAFTRFTSENGYSGGGTHAFYDDGHGTLWIGNDLGVARYDGHAFHQLSQDEGFVGNHVRTLYADKSGTLWAGTYDSGLYRIAEGRITRFTTRDGLPTNGAFQILEDDQSRFWISSNNGIYRIARSELDDVAAGRRRAVTAVRYGKNDGMASQECNGLGQPAGVRARDGRLWFATPHGVAVIDPAAVHLDAEPPPVAILDLVVGGRPTDERQRIEIQPGKTSLEVHYAALTFVRPELAQFKYRVEGLDPDWVDAGTDRTLRYPDLPYGTFTLHIIAANRDGVWNENGARVAIIVIRPFYRTTWFDALGIIAIGLAGFGVHRWRLGLLRRQRDLQERFSRQLIESQEADRRRIAGGLHDGLAQSLIIIKNWAVLAERDLPAAHSSRTKLSEIAKTATEAIGEVREVVQDLMPYQLDRVGFADALEEMAARMGDASSIEVLCRLDDVGKELSSDAQMSLFRVAQEGVNNIVKHSGAAHAEIDLTLDASSLVLTLRDDGRGFVPTSTEPRLGPGGFGLVGMAERTRMMGGTMTVESAPGAGTTVIIRVPIATRESGPSAERGAGPTAERGAGPGKA